jgi:hypothetical protein
MHHIQPPTPTAHAVPKGWMLLSLGMDSIATTRASTSIFSVHLHSKDTDIPLSEWRAAGSPKM